MNKFLIASILLGFLSIIAFSQEDGFYNNNEQKTIETENTLKTFIGFGMGINNHCGMIGALVEFSPFKKFSFIGGAGLGGWGGKTALGMRYYNRGFPKKLFYGLAFTSAGGIQGYEMEMETTTSDSETVEINLNRANNIAITVGYQWMLFRNGRLNFEAGYSFPLQDKAYEVVTSGIELSETSEAMMQVLTPGGLIIGLAFSVGF